MVALRLSPVLLGLGFSGSASALRTAPRGVEEQWCEDAIARRASSASTGPDCSRPALPSLGAPPIWPCKSPERQFAEDQLMKYLDKWDSKSAPGCALESHLRGLPSPGVHLGKLEGAQPFAFGHLVAASKGVVREMEKPVDNKVVMQRSELDESGFGIPATVVIDEGRFVLYYHMSNRGLVGRAESWDGFTWENRTRLGMPRIHNTADFCVLLDKFEENPKFKWKMTANCKNGNDMTCFFSSADGLKWTMHGANTPIYGNLTDTLACLHHDKPGKDYTMTMRYEALNPHLDGRGIRGSIVLNGSLDKVLDSIDKRAWWEARELSRFHFDSMHGDREMFRRQLYSLARTYFPGAGYMGVVQILEFVERSRDAGKKTMLEDLSIARGLRLEEDFDSVFLYLMPSMDGVHFDPSWVYAGVRLLPDELTKGYQFMSQAGELLTHGGYHWVYYDRNPERHFSRWAHDSEIAVARFQEGRLARLHPTLDVGTVVTNSFDFDPCQRLTVDVRSWHKSSSLTVELLKGQQSFDGMDLLEVPAATQSETMHGVNGGVRVEWSVKPDRFQGRPVHLRFSFHAMYLYGFSLESGEC